MSIFTSIPKSKVKRSNFNLSEEVKLSCNFGQLIPILCKEVLPSDTFKLDTELLVKFAPLKAPVMHRIKAKVDYFFVPNFQLTKVFNNFINPKVNTESSPVVMPYVTPKTIYDNSLATGASNIVSSLADYFGLPITQSAFASNTDEQISILPFLAYQHIYNCYYRDQNLHALPETGEISSVGDCFNPALFDEVQGNYALSLTSNELKNLFALRNSCWHKDYFTSALTSPQAGDDVLIPVGGEIPVSADGSLYLQDVPDDDHYLIVGSGNDTLDQGELGYFSTDDDIFSAKYESGLKVDMSAASSISINNFRKLFAIQKYKELCERGGTRYSELALNFFGARIPDMFVDRPLYLGGTTDKIKIGEVVQTSAPSYYEQEEEFYATGSRSGIASLYSRTKSIKFHSVMHGYIIGILRILPEATYQQGLERMWTRKSPYDYAWPQFANIGEQEILNKEIYFGSDTNNKKVFGYTPRYAEYKESHTHVCGKFRTDLDYWHMGRVFGSLPTLSKDFVEMKTMDYDPFYVTDSGTEHVYVNLYNHILAKRPLPYYGVPRGL